MFAMFHRAACIILLFLMATSANLGSLTDIHHNPENLTNTMSHDHSLTSLEDLSFPCPESSKDCQDQCHHFCFHGFHLSTNSVSFHHFQKPLQYDSNYDQYRQKDILDSLFRPPIQA